MFGFKLIIMMCQKSPKRLLSAVLTMMKQAYLWHRMCFDCEAGYLRSMKVRITAEKIKLTFLERDIY